MGSGSTLPRSCAICILAFVSLSVSACAVRTPATHPVQLPLDRYGSHVAYLAHDGLEGRGSGSEGIDLAAGYIAAQFASVGLKPGGPDGSFFQKFSVPRGGEVQDSTYLRFDGLDKALAIEEDFLPLGVSSEGEFSGEVVFVGYGITNPERDHDDYAGVDVADKVAVMLRREPEGWDPSGRYTRHSRFSTKIELAKEHGAVGVIVVNKDRRSASLDVLMPFAPRNQNAGLPAFHMKRNACDLLLANAGLPALQTLQERLDGGEEHLSQPLSGVHASAKVAVRRKELQVRNVIGLLPGQGPDANQYVVIGGHYDHLGVRDGKIHNGADDNASGTAAVMEAAYVLSSMPQRNRGVIFIGFTAEEIGLHGSRHYVESPTVPLDSIVGMLNMDMIGRVDHDNAMNMLAIQGLGTGKGLEAIVKRHAEDAGIPYIGDPSALGPSDHSSFYRAGVPALFFFTGMHEDYHRPGDDIEKVNMEGAVQITQLVISIGAELVNLEEPIEFQEVNRRAQLFRGPSSRGRVVMGIMPVRNDQSNLPGWGIAGVSPNGGAQKAGMKAGDRITRIDKKEISNMADYRQATAEKTPGDVVSVTVLRDGQEVLLNVELQGR